MNKNNILFLAPIYPPQKLGGGPAISINNIVKILDMNKYKLTIITQNYEINDRKVLLISSKKIVKNNLTNTNMYYINYRQTNIINILRLVINIRPNIIYLNSMFSIEYLLSSLIYHSIIKNVKVIIAPRGELCKNSLNQKKNKKKVFIFLVKHIGLLKNVFWHGTSQMEVNAIKNIVNCSSKYIYYINNISFLDTRIILPLNYCKNPNTLKLISIARIHKSKNLLFSIERLKTQTDNIFFDIYGPIEDQKYWIKCKNEIRTLSKNVVVSYKGLVNHDDIFKILAVYDAMILPTLSENYGHSIVEALYSGIPVIISDQTPWTNINIHNAGFAMSLTNKKGFEYAIKYLASLDTFEIAKMKKCAQDYIKTKLNVNNDIIKYNNMFM
jgi:glycosyltransferase involved in cell wall biosynthesis